MIIQDRNTCFKHRMCINCNALLKLSHNLTIETNARYMTIFRIMNTKYSWETQAINYQILINSIKITLWTVANFFCITNFDIVPTFPSSVIPLLDKIYGTNNVDKTALCSIKIRKRNYFNCYLNLKINWNKLPVSSRLSISFKILLTAPNLLTFLPASITLSCIWIQLTIQPAFGNAIWTSIAVCIKIK